jgi:glucose-1-phosphate thymidylyltransferase
MIPVANRPILEHVVDALVEAGVDEIAFVVGYKRDRIQTHFGDGDDWGASIEYVVQDKQLGTGHAVLQAEPVVDGDFLVINGDRIVASSLVERLMERDGDVMAVTRSDEPSEYGVVSLDGDRVESVVEKPPRYATEGDVVNAGVYRFGPGLFDEIRSTEPDDDGEVAITSTLSRMVDAGVGAVWSDDEMPEDVSYLWNLLSVNSSLLDEEDGKDRGRVHGSAVVADAAALGQDATVAAGAIVRSGCSIGDNASIGSNCVIANTVVMADATIGDGAVVRDCIVAENAEIGAATTVEGGAADVVVDGRVYEDVRLGAVVGDNADVGGGANLTPGTVLGDGSTVATGATVAGRVPPDTRIQRG